MRTIYHIIKDLGEVDKLIECCKKTRYCSYDFETNGSPLYNQDFKATIISISFQPGFGCSIPLQHPETPESFNWKKALLRIGHQLLENTDIIKVAWNMKFDNKVWEKFGIYYRGTAIDGMLAKYMLNEERPNGLKDMVRRYLPDYSNYEKEAAFDRIPWDKKPLEQLCQYGCQDTDYTLRLTIFFEKKLIDLGLYKTFRNLIMPASRVLTYVEKKGLYVDRDFNEQLLVEYKQKIDQAKANIYNLSRVKKFSKQYNQQKINNYIASIQEEIDNLDPVTQARQIKSRQDKIARVQAGEFTNQKERDLIRPLNLGSPVDLPLFLFSKDGLNLTPIKTTERGKPSTDEESLTKMRLSIKNPESSKAIFLDNLLDLRALQKMYCTYIEGWNTEVQDDNSLHGTFNIHGTDSGRLCIASDSSVLTNLGLLKIGDIIPPEEGFFDTSHDGIYAYTHEGRWQLILRTINKGYEEMFEVTLKNGNTIKCTANHKFLTSNGWKRLKDIDYEKDEIICYEEDQTNRSL